MKKLLLVFVLTAHMAANETGAQDDRKPIERLEWLIGGWTFEDVQLGGDYREAGERDCAYALDGDYIQCTSKGTSHTGNERTYFFFFNYNHLDERYEMTSLVGGFPRKILYIVNVSEDGHRLELVFGGWEKDGINFESHAIVRYDGVDRYTWESHLAHEGPEADDYEPRFRDTATRRD